jgi:glycosyltransferase involved in cell wall biosynthesis
MSVYALNLLRRLVADGHDVTMISQFRGDEAGTRVYGGGPPPEVPGVRVIGLEARGEQEPGDFERDVAEMVEVALREHGRAPFDVLHAQYGYPTGLAVLEASRQTGVPSVVSIQGGDGHWVGSCCTLHEQAMQAVLDHANAVLIGSASFRDEVVQRLGTDPARFTIVPGAVDTARFTPKAGLDPRQLVYHGRVDRRKGVLDLLDAVERMPDVSLHVSGIGPDLEAVQERVLTTPQVTLGGYADYDQAPRVYHRGGLFVSPTYAEGFSNTILEAMASGLPIVSTRAVGVVDCLRHEDNALLHEPGDVDGLVAALRRMLDDDALRGRLARRALEECRATYSWEVVARQIQGVYAEVQGAPVDGSWSLPDERPDCRFRREPHLL